jgi:hypothetical protein
MELPFTYVEAGMTVSAVQLLRHECAPVAEELQQLVRDRDPHIAVVDVRDDDFAGGNIAGAFNVPSTVCL